VPITVITGESAIYCRLIERFFAGTGDYFSSGNDLGNFMITDMNELAKMAEKGKKVLQ
jgi:hypothetical protein